jgi:hypothetical protein
MAKLSFTKVESAWDDALRKMTIERLKELGAIANLLSDSKPRVPAKVTEQILDHFRSELKKLKKYDRKLYEKLDISRKDEKRFSVTLQELTQEDWVKLKNIREKIDELKKELYGEEVFREEDEKRIKEERIKHINKRFNIRDGWLPLK